MTSSNGHIFRGTGPLCRECTGHWWIPLTKASNAELWCFLWSVAWINHWVNNHEAGDLRCHRVHYDVTVMCRGKVVDRTSDIQLILHLWMKLIKADLDRQILIWIRAFLSTAFICFNYLLVFLSWQFSFLGKDAMIDHFILESELIPTASFWFHLAVVAYGLFVGRCHDCFLYMLFDPCLCIM